MTFTTIILLCALGTPVAYCNDSTALDVISSPATELSSGRGWEETIARGAFKDMAGVYAMTRCVRSHAK